MASYASDHQVADLLGSPPGYVGSTDGARIVRDIRSRQTGQAVMLFDEFGRANADIPQRLMRIFDEGLYRDSTGRLGDFRDAIMILTSNDIVDTVNKSELTLREELQHEHNLDAAIVSRLDGVIGYLPLQHGATSEIASAQFQLLQHRLSESYDLRCTVEPRALERLAQLGETTKGARLLLERVRRLEPEAVDARWRCDADRLVLVEGEEDVTWRAA
jgi:ATP-dependent Clp protease ATP-binding subunit ClpA